MAGRWWGALLLLAASRAPAGAALRAADVERVIGQAVAKATQLRTPATIAVVDREGNVLGIFRMAGARTSTTLRGLPRERSEASFAHGDGLEGVTLPDAVAVPAGLVCGPAVVSGAALAAVSKGGTAAFFATRGNAFTPRTASFIIQPHFPPGIRETPAGPLFGVQFSSLPCSDVMPRLPLGLAGDPGGQPLYEAGTPVGGVGVEGDGVYGVDRNPADGDVTAEERIAVAATRGFEAPREIRADRLFVAGLRFPFANTDDTSGPPAAALATTAGVTECPVRDAPSSRFVAGTVGGRRGSFDPRFFPPHDAADPAPADGGLRADEVLRMLGRGARKAFVLRAAIRRPLGDRARVTIAVVDRGGTVLGVFRTVDAPVFGFDVSVQKARGTAFASSPDAADRLRARGLGEFADAAVRDGLRLDGRIAFAERSVGYLARPFFPDGIDGTAPGPFSRPIARWSPFDDGLQVELVKPGLVALLSGAPLPGGDCTGVAAVAGGIQIFAGAVPLYRGRTLVGAVGVSGDGVDQDDAVATAASRGFGAPRDLRADRVHVRGVRLPYVKLPRRAEIR